MSQLIPQLSQLFLLTGRLLSTLPGRMNSHPVEAASQTTHHNNWAYRSLIPTKFRMRERPEDRSQFIQKTRMISCPSVIGTLFNQPLKSAPAALLGTPLTRVVVIFSTRLLSPVVFSICNHQY